MPTYVHVRTASTPAIPNQQPHVHHPPLLLHRRQLAVREMQKIMGRMSEVEDSVAWRLLNQEGVPTYMNGTYA